ncbi:MAG: hypothetical protein K2J15_07580 [Muribaculaceae bacterium]|nr:hypothetical protein [Muribaculaceae bacterium]
MINRVLIRIKVVQMLYSYLLVENQFTLESQPESPTREKRFAYSLYLEMLALMAEIASDITRRGGDSPLYNTRFISRVAADERIKSIIARPDAVGNPFHNVEIQLAERIKESGLYKKFLKSEDPGSLADEKIWQDLFDNVIMADPSVNKVISGMENYSLSGVDRMRRMMENTFTNFYSAADHLPDALKTLGQSMDKARELYIRLLYLPISLTHLAAIEIDERRKRYLATAEERNPNMRFVENELVEYLSHCDELENALGRYGKSLSMDDEPMLRSLLRSIMASDLYKEYMEFPATDFNRDCEFWKNVYRQIIFENPDFLEALEDKSVFWNDDLEIMGTFVLKTIRRISERVINSSRSESGENESQSIIELAASDSGVLLPKFKDDEDSHFGSELFSAVVKNKELYRKYIDEALDKKIWESERMAYMDVVIMLTAIAELLNFPKIPLNVTVNEYIEIAKSYSTGKSGQFVHGILSAVVSNLRSNGILLK